MVTKAEILNIDFTTNLCLIRIPLFEDISTTNQCRLEAQIAIQPGIYNGYRTGDIVWVAFENGKAELPVVIGKVFTASIDENCNTGGTINCTALNASNKATLPADVLFRQADSNYNTISKIISSLKTLNTAKTKYQICLEYTGETNCNIKLFFNFYSEDATIVNINTILNYIQTNYTSPYRLLLIQSSITKVNQDKSTETTNQNKLIEGLYYNQNSTKFILVYNDGSELELSLSKLALKDCLKIK